MSSALGAVIRGCGAYVRQRVEGWRTGSRGSQAFLLLVLLSLVALAVAVGALARVIMPVSLWFLFLMVGTMLLRFLPLVVLVTVLLGVSVWTSVEASFATASRTSALLIFAVATVRK